jgi:hypothetical protein
MAGAEGGLKCHVMASNAADNVNISRKYLSAPTKFVPQSE